MNVEKVKASWFKSYLPVHEWYVFDSLCGQIVFGGTFQECCAAVETDEGAGVLLVLKGSDLAALLQSP